MKKKLIKTNIADAALKNRNVLSEQKLSVHLIIRAVMFFLFSSATGDSVFCNFVFDRADLKNYK